ncbi:MAG: TetR/AcrR family transcriptional regulator [Gammaproteobacteria bacterium AqS3]|nr:TetR/AcrR family transcriptional regulator [Gammaproteobacteria bacterium AqS3]
MGDSPGKFPKREKKKAETRQKIIDASIELFFQMGAGDVTMEAVAKAAGIHVQTLYSHFPNKLSLMLAGDQHWFDQFTAYMSDPAKTGDTFSRWRDWLKTAYRRFVEDEKKYKHLVQRKSSSLIGFAGLSAIQIQYENVLCEHLASDFDMSADDVGIPRLVAGMLVSGNAAVIRRFLSEDIQLLDESVKAAELVESLFGHLIVHRVRANYTRKKVAE